MEGEEAERTPLIVRRNSHPIDNRRRTRWLGVLLGQLLSILLCLSAVTSVYLSSSYQVHLPTFQNFLFYVILSAVFTSTIACRTTTSSSPGEIGGGLFSVIKSRGWRYFLLALCDAEANFLVVKAYQYTTLTSVQLLDCFTIPTVLLLSRLLLGIRYKAIHLTGVVICLLGVSCLIWADIKEGIPTGEGNDRLLGDILCLSGAFLYGVSNVAQEYLVKTYDMVEFLGMIGMFGAFITAFQACILEWDQVTEAVSSSTSTSSLLAIIGLLLGFAVTQFSFYILAARLMKISGATVYNLSILTADFYSFLAGMFIFQYHFHDLYFISFFLVLTGVIIFSIRSTSTRETPENNVINSFEPEPVAENDD